nr:unnamed protein product [uncultured bacterium]
MVKFKTQFHSHARVFQRPGDPIKVVYSPRYDENGVLDLQPTGEENLYDFIQSHAQSTDIHVILDRFASGETDVLSQIQGFYADASDMPKTYAEVLNAVIAGEQTFDRLPVEIKQKFGNSFSTWLSSMDNPDFAERMGFPKPAEPGMTDSQVQDFAGSSGSAAVASAPSAPSQVPSS